MPLLFLNITVSIIVIVIIVIIILNFRYRRHIVVGELNLSPTNLDSSGDPKDPKDPKKRTSNNSVGHFTPVSKY